MTDKAFRSKFKPSKSSNAQNYIQSNFGFSPSGFGFGSQDGSDFLGIQDNEYHVIFRKISKADITTKTKGLEEFIVKLESLDIQQHGPILSKWIQELGYLLENNHPRVRLLSVKVLGKFGEAMKKKIAPHIKTLLPYWLMACFDPRNEISNTAFSSLRHLIPEHKHKDSLKFALDEILFQANEYISRSVPNKDDIDALEQYERVVSINLDVLTHLVSSIEVDLSSLADKVFKLFHSQQTMIRSRCYQLLGAIAASKKNDLIISKKSNISKLLEGMLQEKTVNLHQHVANSIKLLWKNIPELCDDMNDVLKSLNRFLKSSCFGSSTFLENLVDIISSLPTNLVISASFYDPLFLSMWKGAIGFDSEDSKAVAIRAYFSTLSYILSLGEAEAKDSPLIEKHILPIINAYLKFKERLCEDLPNAIATFLVDIGSDTRIYILENIQSQIAQSICNDNLVALVFDVFSLMEAKSVEIPPTLKKITVDLFTQNLKPNVTDLNDIELMKSVLPLAEKLFDLLDDRHEFFNSIYSILITENTLEEVQEYATYLSIQYFKCFEDLENWKKVVNLLLDLKQASRLNEYLMGLKDYSHTYKLDSIEQFLGNQYLNISDSSVYALISTNLKVNLEKSWISESLFVKIVTDYLSILKEPVNSEKATLVCKILGEAVPQMTRNHLLPQVVDALFLELWTSNALISEQALISLSGMDCSDETITDCLSLVLNTLESKISIETNLSILIKAANLATALSSGRKIQNKTIQSILKSTIASNKLTEKLLKCVSLDILKFNMFVYQCESMEVDHMFERDWSHFCFVREYLDNFLESILSELDSPLSSNLLDLLATLLNLFFVLKHLGESNSLNEEKESEIDLFETLALSIVEKLCAHKENSQMFLEYIVDKKCQVLFKPQIFDICVKHNDTLEADILFKTILMDPYLFHQDTLVSWTSTSEMITECLKRLQDSQESMDLPNLARYVYLLSQLLYSSKDEFGISIKTFMSSGKIYFGMDKQEPSRILFTFSILSLANSILEVYSDRVQESMINLVMDICEKLFVSLETPTPKSVRPAMNMGFHIFISLGNIKEIFVQDWALFYRTHIPRICNQLRYFTVDTYHPSDFTFLNSISTCIGHIDNISTIDSTNTDSWFETLKIPHLLAKGASYSILHRLIQKDVLSHMNDSNQQCTDETIIAPQILRDIIEKSDYTAHDSELSLNLHLDHDLDRVFNLVYCWALLLEYLLTKNVKERADMVQYIRNLDTASDILALVFNILSKENLIQDEIKLSPNADRGLILSHMALKVAKMMFSLLPALVREWWSDLSNRGLKNSAEKLSGKYISPDIIEKELRDAKEYQPLGSDCFRLKVAMNCNELTAGYTQDDMELTIVLRIPTSYPLKCVSVEMTQKKAVQESLSRKWILSMITLLMTRDGSILDAALLWKQYLDKHFEGVECCPICYCIFHASNFSLPNMACKTCKNKFHSACLYKWFKTSHKNECPLCKQPFN